MAAQRAPGPRLEDVVVLRRAECRIVCRWELGLQRIEQLVLVTLLEVGSLVALLLLLVQCATEERSDVEERVEKGRGDHA